jgi:Zn-dependent protease
VDVEAAIINVALLILLTVPHEYAHAWVAEKLGDDTPRLEGRVTLYPLAHIDWLGTVILPAITSLMGAGFLGWGRPVNTNPYRLRWGMNGLLLVALAGPVSNVILAVILAFLVVIIHSVAPILAEFLVRGIPLSLYLALFNMIPVPPLDGSKLLLAMRIPPAIYGELARFGFLLVLLAMSYTGMASWMSYWSLRGARGILSLFGV